MALFFLLCNIVVIMAFAELLPHIARQILLFGWAILVLVLLVVLVYALRVLWNVRKFVKLLHTTTIQLRDTTQKLMDPLMMFLNMLRMNLENPSPKPNKKRHKSS